MDEKDKKGVVGVPGSETQQKESASVPGGDAALSTTPSSKWRDVIKGRNKDLNVDDDDAVAGYLNDEFGRLDKSDETNRRMNELIGNAPRNATMLQGIFSGKDEDGEEFNLVNYLLTEYYDELKESADSEEMLEKVNKKMAAKEKAAAEEAQRSKTIEENFQKMNEALTAAIKKTGIDEATAQQVLDWLYGTDKEAGLYLRIPQRAITEDDFEKLIHAYTRDESLEKARNDGRQEGRMRRPGAAHRSNVQANTDLGGGSGGNEPEEDKNPTASRYTAMRPRF